MLGDAVLNFSGEGQMFAVFAGIGTVTLVALALRCISSYSAYGVRSVECWFCSHRLSVPRAQVNSFKCPSCGQYNGFTSDGDYNIRIPEQYDARLNRPITSRVPKPFNTQSNVFCDRCAVNQAILVKKIASFEPKSDRWQNEFRTYTRKLECIYSLCRECQAKATARIHQVDSHLLPSFLDWWRKFRRHLPAMSMSLSENSTTQKVDDPYLPKWLCLLMRMAIASCFVALISEPMLSALEKQLCLVQEGQKRSFGNHMTQVFFLYKSLRSTVLPHCSHLSHYVILCTLPKTGKFAFSLLLFALQLALLIISVHNESNSPRKRSRSHFHVSTLLIDAIILLFALSILIPIIPDVLAQTNVPHLMHHGRAPPIFLILLVLGLLLATGAILGLRAWLTSCSNDWRSQRRALTRSWPGCIDPDVSCASVSGYAASVSSHRTPQSTDHQSSPISSLSESPNRITRTAISSTSSSPPRSAFRPSVLTWPPQSRNTPWAPSFSTEPRVTGNIASDVSDSDDASLITSVSQLRASPQLRTTRSTSSKVSKSRSGHGIRHRHRKRKGLLRFCLSFLFGRLDSWKDVLDELTSLFNALLVGVIIYGICRLFLTVTDLV